MVRAKTSADKIIQVRGLPPGVDINKLSLAPITGFALTNQNHPELLNQVFEFIESAIQEIFLFETASIKPSQQLIDLYSLFKCLDNSQYELKEETSFCWPSPENVEDDSILKEEFDYFCNQSITINQRKFHARLLDIYHIESMGVARSKNPPVDSAKISLIQAKAKRHVIDLDNLAKQGNQNRITWEAWHKAKKTYAVRVNQLATDTIATVAPCLKEYLNQI